MNKKSVASIELAALVNELQFVVGGKLSQIYHQDKKELVFQLHARGQGKQLLKVIPGKFVCLTDSKGEAPRPTGFCMLLRKYIGNASITSFQQKDSERIVVFELEKKEKFFLVVELFSKGNIILTNSSWKIIGSLERQIWKDRVVKPHEQYIFPEVGVNWKTISLAGLEKIISLSDRKNLATTLATEIGLGGVYAEEVCSRSGVDKDLLPNEVSKVNIKKVFTGIKEILSLLEKPAGFMYEKDIIPFELSSGEVVKKYETYNEAINTINPFQKSSPYQNKIRALERMISTQEKAVRKQEGNIEKNKLKGELIYEKYNALQKLKDIVKELRETKEWKEVSKELKKEKKIKAVDLKQKKVFIDL